MRGFRLLVRHGRAVAAIGVIALVVVTTSVVALTRQDRPTGAHSTPVKPMPTAQVPPAPGTAGPAGPPASAPPTERNDLAAVQIARIRALDPVVSSPGTPKITGEATTQPDLYAAEFVRRLLVQDYRQPREDLLQWVQAESATTHEPLVTGKVPPELRDRLAVFSVTDAADAPAPIPTPADWDGFGVQGAYTTVEIDRVEEPFSWTNAVASGRITDPGVSARQVTATVTRHVDDKRHPPSVFSVSVLLNLEGPPTRRDWGFVAVLSYTAIQVR